MKDSKNANPIDIFKLWYIEAGGKPLDATVTPRLSLLAKVLKIVRYLLGKIFPASAVLEPNAVALGTSTLAGQSSLRMVLFKGFKGESFLFYTNSVSQKGQELAQNPNASLLFYWPIPSRQVRIQGVVQELSYEATQSYWATRPRGSQISAMASKQSQKIASPEEFDLRVKELESEWANKPIPCPSYWKGYELTPRRYEFWQGRLHRAHDRLLFEKNSTNQWISCWLAP